MTKAEIAQYLVNLHTLLNAQTATGNAVPSTTLAAEYDKHWTMFKDAVSKETTDETRHGQQPVRRPEAGTDRRED